LLVCCFEEEGKAVLLVSKICVLGLVVPVSSFTSGSKPDYTSLCEQLFVTDSPDLERRAWHFEIVLRSTSFRRLSRNAAALASLLFVATNRLQLLAKASFIVCSFVLCLGGNKPN